MYFKKKFSVMWYFFLGLATLFDHDSYLFMWPYNYIVKNIKGKV